MITVFIGKDRNKAADLESDYYPIVIGVRNDVNDLRDITDIAFNIIVKAVNLGARKLLIKNAEIIFPGNCMPYLKEKMPDVDFLLTTKVNYLCWSADEIRYFGDKKYDKIYLDRIRYGNIVEAYGTNLLEL